VILTIGAYVFVGLAFLFCILNWCVPFAALAKKRRGEPGGVSGFPLVPQSALCAAALFDWSAGWTLVPAYVYWIILVGDILLWTVCAALLGWVYRKIIATKLN
jgi:hypothetical protein